MTIEITSENLTSCYFALLRRTQELRAVVENDRTPAHERELAAHDLAVLLPRLDRVAAFVTQFVAEDGTLA